jgi:phosphoserine phosphatase RsbU/P
MAYTMLNSFRSKLINFPKHANLRTLLLVPVVLQIVFAVGLTGYLSLQNSLDSIREFIQQLRYELSYKIHDHLHTHLQTPLQVNRVMLDSLDLGLGNIDEPRSAENLLLKLINAFPSVSYVQLANEKGEFLGYERADEPKGKLTIEMLNAQTDYSFNTYLTDEHGRATEELIASSANYDPRLRPWYIPAATTLQTRWSEVYVYTGIPRLAITVTSPVFNDKQQFVGVVGTDLSLLAINQFLQQQRISKTGIAFITEPKTKLLIATSTGEQPFTTTNGTLNRLSALDSKNYLTAKITQLLYQNNLVANNQSLDFKIDGKRYYVQLLPYKDNMGLDWLIHVVIPEEDFMQPIYQNGYITIILIFITWLVASVIALITAHWIATPVERLSQAAQGLSTGDWQQSKTIHKYISGNELGQLATAFASMAQQLQDLFSQLENKVEVRTRELAEANEEIRVLNEYLQEENQRMSAELDITHKLQQMVLPTKQELQQITELDIGAFMYPAEEIGGDYYDVLVGKDSIKIAIGDVTGHGLESGVIMLMTQMAVRTLLETHIQNPATFLNLLNKAVFANIKRMDSDKNLTLSLLDYQQGLLSITGQHEEILVIRNDGSLERIDTVNLGFMVGLLPDISKLVTYIELNLAQGDGIVLYTDGITEAHNQAQELYGIEKLGQIAQQYWHLSANEIGQAIIRDVRTYMGKQKAFDDITLLILKRK